MTTGLGNDGLEKFHQLVVLHHGLLHQQEITLQMRRVQLTIRQAPHRPRLLDHGVEDRPEITERAHHAVVAKQHVGRPIKQMALSSDAQTQLVRAKVVGTVALTKAKQTWVLLDELLQAGHLILIKHQHQLCAHLP